MSLIKGETEVKKDIEWLKDEILTDMLYLEGNREIRQLDIKYQTLREVVQKINSLDEPETLSPEWIDENLVYADINGKTEAFLNEHSVRNLLVPKQDEREQLEVAYKDILNRGEFWFDDKEYKVVPKQDELTDEQIARKVDQAYKDGYEKGKEHATEKQSEEAETVASVFVDFLIASAKFKLALSMEVEELEE